jgi:hypothetical protein
MGKILSFGDYQKIFEADEDTQSSNAAEQLTNAFYQVYTGLISGIDGGYSGVIDDLNTISNEKDVTKKGDRMSEVINNMLNKINSTYKSQISSDVNKFTDALKKSYTDLSNSEDGKKSQESINDKISGLITAYVKNLVDIVNKNKQNTDIKDTSVKESLNTEEQDHIYESQLFEKNLFNEERGELVKTIDPKLAQVKQIQDNSTSPALKTAASTAFNDLTKIEAELKSDDTWTTKNRRERRERLAEIPTEIDAINKKMNDANINYVIQSNIDKNISKGIQDLLGTVSIINTKVADLIKKQSEAEAKKKDDDTKKEDGSTKEGDFKEIISGNIDKDNLRKVGKNRDSIQKFQKTFNTLFTNEQIKDDGLYGKNTESAVLKTAKMISGLMGEDITKGTEDGKKLTPELQKAISKFIANKDKIKELIIK